MKTIPLNGKYGSGLETLVSDADYESLSKYKWWVRRDRTTARVNYVVRYTGLDVIFMHRQILGDKKGYYSDHINRNTLDNRRENLRHLTPKESVLNRDYGLRGGVSKSGNRWIASARLDRKIIYLGMYDTNEEAREVASQKAVEIRELKKSQFKVFN